MVTRPPDLAIAARPDENVAKVHVEFFVPLFLQLISKQAGIWALQALLLRLAVIATADSIYGYIGMACKSACMRDFKSRRSSA